MLLERRIWERVPRMRRHSFLMRRSGLAVALEKTQNLFLRVNGWSESQSFLDHSFQVGALLKLLKIEDGAIFCGIEEFLSESLLNVRETQKHTSYERQAAACRFVSGMIEH